MKVEELLESKESLSSLRAERDRLTDKKKGPGGNPRDQVNIDKLDRQIKQHPDYKSSTRSAKAPKEKKRDYKADYVKQTKAKLKKLKDKGK